MGQVCEWITNQGTGGWGCGHSKESPAGTPIEKGPHLGRTVSTRYGMVCECKDTWKRVFNKEEELLMEGRIVDDSNLYVVDQAYFGNIVKACQVEPATESDKDSAA